MDIKSLFEDKWGFEYETPDCQMCGEHVDPDKFDFNLGWCEDCLREVFDDYYDDENIKNSE